MKMKIISFTGAVLIFAISFCVYYLTVSPYVQPGDSTEMVTAAVVLGIPHQPGYPLNTIFGHVAYRINLPGISGILKINLVSAFFQSLTAVVFYFLVIELTRFIQIDKGDDSRGLLNGLTGVVAGFSSALFMAFSLIYWQYATKFEVFPLNNLYTVGIICLVVVWLNDTKKSYGNSLRGEMRKFVIPGVLGLLGGLAVTHHQTIILIFPSLAILISGDYKKIITKANIKHLVCLVVFGLTGILSYFGMILKIASKDPAMDISHVVNAQSALEALFRSEYGTFSAYLKYEKPVIETYPSDQVVYYLRNIWTDFSIFGVIFMLVGAYYLYKRSKKVLNFLLVGIFVSGVVFLAYANFPLSDGFNQATVRRFHMLPNIYVSLMLAFGIYYIAKYISSISGSEGKMAKEAYLVYFYLIISFGILVYRNYPKATSRNNNLTDQFVLNSYGSIPDNSLVMVSGDIQNMTGDYFRLVEKPDSKIKIFTPGRFYLGWYLDELITGFPDLKIPVPPAGKKYTTVSQIIEANYGEFPIYISPDLIVRDPDIEKKFTLYPRSLLMEVKKKGEDLKLEEWKAENEALWKNIDAEYLRLFLTGVHFENPIVFSYIRHFYNIGFVYKDVKLYNEAIIEFERVLEIDSGFKEALIMLSEAYASKPDPDYGKAIEHLQRFQSILTPSETDQFYAAQNKIVEYDKKYRENYQKELEKQKMATESGETK